MSESIEQMSKQTNDRAKSERDCVRLCQRLLDPKLYPCAQYTS